MEMKSEFGNLWEENLSLIGKFTLRELRKRLESRGAYDIQFEWEHEYGHSFYIKFKVKRKLFGIFDRAQVDSHTSKRVTDFLQKDIPFKVVKWSSDMKRTCWEYRVECNPYELKVIK
ncbi:MAG: hypothetical protein GOV00_00415 [Candidatus Altiarchaeota archaeon]|nr:hypothetical protein [Candidatus Altiarchaeota archaeon]